MCIRSALDVPNRRMYNETRMELGDEQEVVKVVYQKGRATMTDSFSEGLLELPKAQVEQMEGIFESIFDQVSNYSALPEEYEHAAYNGIVSYGGVVQGEQVTVTVDLSSFVPVEPTTRSTTMRLIFDDRGRHLASIFHTPDGPSLFLYENPEDPVPYRRYVNAATYTLGGKKATLVSKTRVTRYRLNKPLDEVLFRLEDPSSPKTPKGR